MSPQVAHREVLLQKGFFVPRSNQTLAQPSHFRSKGLELENSPHRPSATQELPMTAVIIKAMAQSRIEG
ncbi:hypothetical protein EVAR_29631_1 [Eumeta japonica]|uniref:Uncharacterized protein n=1 Tax=Eumeta variegata TaxID=151549 RepID=A0A4C1W922_EUMVA|nr:hypothetical protein EVAR_29631_1 [Eumeta japonica]